MKIKRFFAVLLYVVALGFVLKQAQEQHVAFALFLGIVLFRFRNFRREAAPL